MSDPSVPPEADAGDAPARPAVHGPTERRNSSPLAFAAVLLIPLAATGWVAWRQVALQNELAGMRAENAALQEASAATTARIAEVQQAQQELSAMLEQASQQTLQQAQEEFAASSAALEQQAQQIHALEAQLGAMQLQTSEREVGGAPLAEAEMLLRIAQQRLSLARDTSTATGLYIAADELLRSVDNASVQSVRDALARELAALQAAPVVDVAGLYARLGAQGARVENFAVASEGAVEDFAVTASSADAPAARGWWEGVRETVGNYFVVTRSTAEILPQLSAGEQYQVRALVQLHIEQARLAVLRADPAVYRAALDSAIATAQRWLRGDAGSVEDFVATLEELRDTPILVDLPTTGQALTALRQLPGMTAPEVAMPPAATESEP